MQRVGSAWSHENRGIHGLQLTALCCSNVNSSWWSLCFVSLTDSSKALQNSAGFFRITLHNFGVRSPLTALPSSITLLYSSIYSRCEITLYLTRYGPILSTSSLRMISWLLSFSDIAGRYLRYTTCHHIYTT